MKLAKPSYMILTPIDSNAILKFLEVCTRTAYKSEDKITEGSDRKLIASILERGHEAVIEHYSLTVKFVCDRGISHELVRHRLASFTQESTRYCNYGKDKFGGEITVIEPFYLDKHSAGYGTWEISCRQAEKAYFDLLEFGCRPEEARAVLPTCLKTEVVMTADLREWRHFFKLRCSEAAHPQMRELARPLLKELHAQIPVIFDDVYAEVFRETEE